MSQDGPNENELWGEYGEGVARRAFGLEMDRACHHDARDSHGNPWEVKACRLYVGSRDDVGRYFIRWENHEQLREDGGYYAFVLYDPFNWKQGPVLAMDVKPAAWLDDVDRSWCPNGARRGETVCRPLWTDLFSPEEIPGVDNPVASD